MSSLSLGRPLGYVAEFCLFCRWITSQRLHQAICFEPQGHSSSHATRCLGCGHEQIADPALFKGMEKDPRIDLERLIVLTNPAIRYRIADRLNVETRLQAGPIEPEARAELLCEPIRVLAPTLLDPPGGSWLGYLFLADILIVPALYLAAWLTPKPFAKVFLIGALSLSALTLSLIVVLALSFPLWKSLLRRRYLRDVIYPLLSRSLRPLKPTRHELESALQRADTVGVEFLTPHELEEALRSTPNRPLDS